jgi:hypothetical protein
MPSRSCRLRPAARRTVVRQLRIGRVLFRTEAMKSVLERVTNPKLSRRTCTCEYGLQCSEGKSAGVAKQPRGIPNVTIRDSSGGSLVWPLGSLELSGTPSVSPTIRVEG